MSLKVPANQNQPFSNTFSKTFHKQGKKTRLPSIHNENVCNNELIENRYCHNVSKFSQSKCTVVPLSTRKNSHNEHQRENILNNHGNGHKKVARVFAEKPKSLINKLQNDKKIITEDREITNTHRMSMKLEKLNIKNTLQLCPSQQLRQNQLGINTLHFDKIATGNSNTSHHKAPFRDRTNSCRVSFKRVFPTQEKEKQQIETNVSIFFRHTQERLSTIAGDQDKEQSNFFSMESFSELIS